jgi:DNA ligase (NAD+)
MELANAKLRIEQLTNTLKDHNYRYYVLAEPIISDFDFDQILKELEYLELQFPQFVDPNSPTKKVGGSISEGFITVKHQRPMLSLANSYNEEELREFDDRICKATGLSTIEYVCELKIDGLAISVFYENGKLLQAITRGDGIQGDDVTENVKTIRSLTHTLSGNYPEKFEMRGEIFMHRKGFDRLNEQRKAAGEAEYANPRNVASGSLKTKDTAEVAKRPLDIYLYYLLADEGRFSNHAESLDAAKSWGLKIAETSKVCNGIDQVLAFLHEWDEKRHDLSFDTDGVVIKVNNKNLQEELGFTAKTPRWAIAYKFQTETATTNLLGITYQVGRTGAITPVAELQPVALLGTTVKRASLHNANEMQRLDVRIGDMVFVEKGGEIIPKIVGIDFSQRALDSQPETYITRCPECQTELVRAEGEAHHYCPNDQLCPPQVIGKIEHFVGRKAMDIQSIGAEMAETLYRNNLVKTAADLYDLTFEQLIQLERMGEKSANNIIEGIQASKQQPFERVLFSMGIRYIGETVAKKLVAAFLTIEALMAASVEDMLAVDEIGERIAQTLFQTLQNPRVMQEIERFKSAGLRFETQKIEKASEKLAGKIFVISGVFENHSRDELKDLVENNGGKMASGITSKTNFLIAGSGVGPSKLEKAQQLGVTSLSEDELINMIQE